MIQLSRNYTLPEQQDDAVPITVIGVGGAGSNALDRIVLDGLERAELIVANTDVQSLASSVAQRKVQLGRTITRGLGTGGDPDLGHEAAIEAAHEIREAIADAGMIFVCAGLGGGTGSGAAPVIAEIAAETGALVVSFVTMPFTFEGKRRAAQASEALSELQAASSAVICFENDKMGDMVAPKAGVHQAFAAADVTISQSVRAIVNLMQRPGLIRIGFDDLLSALRNPNARCLFGFGESDSDNRAHDALTQALKSPLMDRGRLLGDAANVLVQVAGGPGMTLSEVEILMNELARHIGEDTQILFGTSVDNRMGNRLAVTLISSLAADGGVADLPPRKRRTQPKVSQPESRTAPKKWTPDPLPAEPAPLAPVAEQAAEVEETPEPVSDAAPPPPPQLKTIEAPLAQQELLGDEAHERQVIEPEEKIAAFAPPPPAPAPEPEPEPQLAEPEVQPPRVILPKKKPPLIKESNIAEKIVAKQEVLQFESVTRGRFEKSEPTIVEGQDLDVPTFLRKNVRVK